MPTVLAREIFEFDEGYRVKVTGSSCGGSGCKARDGSIGVSWVKGYWFVSGLGEGFRSGLGMVRSTGKMCDAELVWGFVWNGEAQREVELQGCGRLPCSGLPLSGPRIINTLGTIETPFPHRKAPTLSNDYELEDHRLSVSDIRRRTTLSDTVDSYWIFRMLFCIPILAYT